MKQYKVTYNVNIDEGSDCVLSPDDPLHAMKEGMFLGSVPGVDVYVVYPEPQSQDSDEKIIPYGQH